MSERTKNIFRFLRWIKRRDLFIFPEINLPTEHLGNQGADWFIHTKKLNENSIIYSVGIGTDISFDLELINKFNCQVFAFDPTPKSLQWLSSQSLPNHFKYFPIGLSDYDGTLEFFAPNNENHTSFTIINNQYQHNKKPNMFQVKKLSSLMNDNHHTQIDVLKMDIEGAEYHVIDDIIKSNILIDQILIEFHHRFKSVGLEKTNAAIKKLQSAGYQIFSISTSGEEYSFIKRK